MEKRKLGRTDLEISTIGIGCASFWGKKQFNEAEAIRLIEIASDRGVNYFDTGFSYSAGNAELRLGRALKQISNSSDFIVSSKAGTRISSLGKYVKDFSPSWIEESINQSLTNIGIAHLPLFQLHGPQLGDITDELLSLLFRLKTEGVIGFVGVNTFDTTVIEKVLSLNCFDFIMLDYNILQQDREPLIEKLHASGVGVIAGAALANSLYSNRIFKVTGVKDIWYLARALKNHRSTLLKGRKFAFVNDIPHLAGSQVAISYILNNKYVSSAVFGTTSERHLIENIGAIDVELAPELISKIREASNL